MSVNWETYRNYQADDDELQAWADWAELQKDPKPDFRPNMKTAIISGLAGWAILAGVAYVAWLAWNRV